MAKILIVDDQPMILNVLKAALTADGHDISTVSLDDLALKLVGFMVFDVIVTDHALPHMNEFLETAQQKSPGIPIIMIADNGTAKTAMDAMAKGAFDYLTKPFSLEALRSTVNAAVSYLNARKEGIPLPRVSPDTVPYPNIVAASPAMAGVCRRIDELRRTDSPVLIEGEPGTGREMLARTIHAQGLRRPGAFERVDSQQRSADSTLGLAFAEAEGGTVFFHEIGAIAPSAQQELLRILLTSSYATGPDTRPIELTTRVMASTSVPLAALVANGKLDPDFLHLFEKSTVVIPPLRIRPEDIRAHIGLMLGYTQDRATNQVPIDTDALVILEHYPWPGSVPELTEVIRTATTMARGEPIGVAHLPREITTCVNPANDASLRSATLNQFRGRIVKNFLEGKKKDYSAVAGMISAFRS
jgi:two-component system, NtrC family, response regulator AtoC